MELKAVRRCLLEKMDVGKGTQLPFGSRDTNPDQGGGRPRPYFRSRMQTEEPERPPQFWSQRLVRPREDHARVTQFVLRRSKPIKP